MVTSSVGLLERVAAVFLERDALSNFEDTLSMSGLRVGRQRAMVPQAASTTHQVHAVARVPIGVS